MNKVPYVVIPIGDPGGIGPEVICKTLSRSGAGNGVIPVLIGSIDAIEEANRICGTSLIFEKLSSIEHVPSVINAVPITDDEGLASHDITIGSANPASGRAQVRWLESADRICRSGAADALVMGPINSEAVEMANAWSVVEQIAEPLPNESYLLVITGPLRVVHLIHHRPVLEVCRLIRKDTILHALEMTNDQFQRWGAPAPRIGVAGWNPHAYGDEETKEIKPAIAEAQHRGMNVSGPISPDTIFRHAIEGRYDVVLAMSHDQGHIAIKTWGFKGNFSVTLGVPYISTSVAHGTAYDIAGQGVADEANFFEAHSATIGFLHGRGLSN